MIQDAKTGDLVYANIFAEEWGFTEGNLYSVLDITPHGYLLMANDNGEVDAYSGDYFRKTKPMVLHKTIKRNK